MDLNFGVTSVGTQCITGEGQSIRDCRLSFFGGQVSGGQCSVRAAKNLTASCTDTSVSRSRLYLYFSVSLSVRPSLAPSLLLSVSVSVCLSVDLVDCWHAADYKMLVGWSRV